MFGNLAGPRCPQEEKRFNYTFEGKEKKFILNLKRN